MAKIFITGSADGLGLLAAKSLIAGGHEVVVHARSKERGQQALRQSPGAAGVLVGDLSDIDATKNLAEQANAYGGFDAVIHNAGIYNDAGTAAGLPAILVVNTLAPYILTCLMKMPQRLVYLSSGMHTGGSTRMTDWQQQKVTYSDTKLYDLLLAKMAARHFPGVYANAVDPGWVPTKMGGPGAPDSIEKGYQTQVWLAVSNDPTALVSGQYFHHQRPGRQHGSADDTRLQHWLMAQCEKYTGISFPLKKQPEHKTGAEQQ